MSNIGIIDIGSNTIHLQIVKVNSNGTTQVLDSDKEHLRLGANIQLKKNIDSEKILHTVTTIKKYLRLCVLYKTSTVIAIATEAMRVAENGQFIVDYILKHTGVKIKILSKEEEAYFSFLGVTSLNKIDDGIIVDLGGGSTELINVKDNSFKNYISLPLGAINVTENITVLENGIYNNSSYNQEFFFDIFSKIDFLKNSSKKTLTGIGGTFKNLKSIYMSNNSISSRGSSLLSVPSMEILNLCNDLKSMTSKEREKLKGLSKKRTDIILGGCEIIENIIKYNDFKYINICDEGLRTGILINYLSTPIKE